MRETSGVGSSVFTRDAAATREVKVPESHAPRSALERPTATSGFTPVALERPTTTTGLTPVELGARDRAGVSANPQSVLAGRYVILSTLGRGAMGVVHRAYDQAVRREVAIKVLQTRHWHAQERLVEEARAMAKLSHPHVVTVYEVVAAGDASDDLLLVMQYVQGQTLGAWLKKDRSVQEVLSLFRQAGQGLLAAHRAGLIHRDFKPENVLVDEDGRAFVTDFGIAGSCDDEKPTDPGESLVATSHGRVLGTPWYMAPEQHLGLPVDPRADQYAFCIALWEALARQPIFTDVSDSVGLLARKHEPLPKWPRTEGVPPRVVNALYRGLCLRSEDRFASMAELLAALETKRWWTVAGASAAVASVIAVGSVASTALAERSERCTGASDSLGSTWDDDARQRVRQSLLATKVPYAEDTAMKVEEHLDTFVTAWLDGHRSACISSSVLREQPVEVMDLQMACLHRRKVELQSVVNVLRQADSQVVEKAVTLVLGLPSLQRCADIEALQAEVPPPENATDAAKVEQARVLLAEAKAQETAGKYSTALAKAEAAEAALAGARYLPVKAEIDLVKGWSLMLLGEHGAAEAALQRALTTALAVGSAGQASRAASWLTHLFVGDLQARLGEGLWLAQQAIEYGRLSGDVAFIESEAHNAMGAVLLTQGRYDEAEVAFRQALAGSREVLGAGHPHVANYWSNLGSAEYGQGRYAVAESHFRQALEIWTEVLGSQHPQVAAGWNNVAGTLLQQGRLEEAEVLHRRALELRKRALGPEHPRVAISHDNLGVVLSQQGKFAAAEAEQRHALALRERVLGEGHPETANTHFNLSDTLKPQGRLDEAEAHMRRALAVYEKVFGRDHSHVADARLSLGDILRLQRRLEESEAQLREAVAVYERVHRSEHPQLAIAQEALAVLLHAQGRHDEAEVEYRRALAMAEQTMDPDAPDLARILHSYGSFLVHQRRDDQARALLERAWSIRSSGSVPPGERAETAFVLAKVLWRTTSQRPRAISLARAAERDHRDAGEVFREQQREVSRWLAMHEQR